MKKLFIVVLFIVLIMIIAAPAGASQREDVTITVNSEYTYWPGYSLAGSWSASGAIDNSGTLFGVPKHFGAGSPKGKPFQTAHVIEVIESGSDSLTISAQFKDLEFTSWAPCATGLCQTYKGKGTWVILSGEGEYANARGRGTAFVSGIAYLVTDSDGDNHFEGQDIETIYEGSIHFDPQ